MDDIEKLNSKEHKTWYDARLRTTDTIGRYLDGIAQAQLSSDFVSWYRLLNGLYALTHGFIKEIDHTKFETQSKVISSLIDMWRNEGRHTRNQTIEKSLDKKLMELTTTLYNGIRNLLMPSTTVEEVGFNVDDFLAGSR